MRIATGKSESVDANVKRRISRRRNVELTDAAINRVCDLMNAIKTNENHVVGFSMEFSVDDEQYTLTFLPDQLVVLWPAKPHVKPHAQFLFQCNAVEIEPRSTADRYMLCFTDERGRDRIPRLLIAGGTYGVSHFRFYSIPGTGISEEFQFPQQL